MNVLAIDTATTACGVGISTDGGVTIVRVLDEARHHTETLTPGIISLLEECGLAPSDIDRVVVDRGPGLYTGLRVGVTTATSLAQALGCALVSVTSLELLAWGARDAGVRGTALCAVDARRGEVFVQTFHLGEGVEAVGEPEVASPRTVVITWATNGAPATFTGDGVARYLEDFAAVPNATVFAQSVPSLHAALALGATRDPVTAIAPLYLRDADAVANFSTRERSV